MVIVQMLFGSDNYILMGVFLYLLTVRCIFDRLPFLYIEDTFSEQIHAVD